MEGDRILPRSFILRVFAVPDGSKSWRVLPGGLTRIAGAGLENASMQRGGSSADTWVLTDGALDTRAWATGQDGANFAPRHGITSRAAENLFWLGRYTERTENAIRLAPVAGTPGRRSAVVDDVLIELAAANGLLPQDAPASKDRRAVERLLIGSLADTEGAASVGHTLRALRNAASAVRERLSQEQWKLPNRSSSAAA